LVSSYYAFGVLFILRCVPLIVQRDAQAAHDAGVPLGELIKVDPATGLNVLPHWLAQPYFRPLPPPISNPKKGG
jgi:tRNA-dihydrouridine synthase 1